MVSMSRMTMMLSWPLLHERRKTALENSTGKLTNKSCCHDLVSLRKKCFESTYCISWKICCFANTLASPELAQGKRRWTLKNCMWASKALTLQNGLAAQHMRIEPSWRSMQVAKISNSFASTPFLKRNSTGPVFAPQWLHQAYLIPYSRLLWN